jgi:predicted porin
MKFAKRCIALTASTFLTVPAFATDSAAKETKPELIDIYGKANVTVQSSDDGAGRFTEVKSNASRIGFKGTHALNDGLEVVYKAEFQVDIDGDGDVFKGRNQYIGLKGAYGEVLLGKNDTMLKQSQGKVDLFNDLNADIKSLWKGENRLSDTISYKSPKFNGLQFGVTYIAEDSIEAQDAVSLAVFYGDKKLKKSKIYAALAHDAEVKGYDVTRAVLQGKISGITLGGIVQTQENISTGAKLDGFMVSAKYKVGETTFKGQYQVGDNKDGDNKSGISAGVDYALAKSTKLFAFYTSFDMDSAVDEDYLAAGIEYKF